MSAFPDIDLSKLPVPDVFAPIEADTLLEQATDLFVELFPDAAETIALDSDPIRKLLQVSTLLRVLDRDTFRKDAAIGLVATASGAALDQRAAQIPLTRHEGESDADFRKRIRFAPEAFSVAGPKGAYIALSENAHPDVQMVAVRSPHVADAGPGAPEAGEVFVYVVGADDGTLPQVVRDAVEAALNDDSAIPTSAKVEVKEPALVAIDVTAELRIEDSLSSAVVGAAAQDALEAYLKSRFTFGGEVTLSGIIAALTIEGVIEVSVTTPAANPAAAPYSVPVPGAITLTLTGGGA